MALFQYINQLNRSAESSNGQQLSLLLRKNRIYRTPNKSNITANLEPNIEKLSDIDDYCHGQIAAPYNEITASHFKCLIALKNRSYVDAYTHQAALAQSFVRVFQTESGNWTLPVMHTVNQDLRLISKLADWELRKKGQKEDKREDAARILNSCFSVCIRDSVSPDSKKYGTLHVINNLFKIYFSLNNLRLCKNLIKPVENKGFPPLTQFPVSQVVTYRFYVGRLAMFDGHFRKAEEELSFAFQRCTKKNIANKKLILLYLIPVKILLGKMPSHNLLAKYNFTQFEDLTKAVVTGNLRLFNETLTQHQDFFIQKGTFLILEKSKILTYRNLFKRVVNIMKNTKIPLSTFVKAFAWLGIQIDVAEIECILANLIFTGYVKGYISHQMGFLVVSAKSAFPPLSAIPSLNAAEGK